MTSIACVKGQQDDFNKVRSRIRGGKDRHKLIELTRKEFGKYNRKYAYHIYRTHPYFRKRRELACSIGESNIGRFRPATYTKRR